MPKYAFIGLGKKKGTWNSNTNVATSGSNTFTTALTGSGYDAGGQLSTASLATGDYWEVDTTGSTRIVDTTSWKLLDWLVFDGATWVRLSNADKVSSVIVGSAISGGTNALVNDSAPEIDGQVYFNKTINSNTASFSGSNKLKFL